MKLTTVTAALAVMGLVVAGCASQPVARRAAALSSRTPCQALYATRPSKPVIAEDLPYGSPATLLLGFADDDAKARAVDYTYARAVDYAYARAVDYTYAKPGFGEGNGLGVLANLPVLALEVPVLTRETVDRLAADLGPLGLLSVYADAPIQTYSTSSVAATGADRARLQTGLSGRGVGIAVIDTGVDATHPDLALGRTTARNVKVVGSLAATTAPIVVDAPDTDLVSGHGTHVAAIAVGSGDASAGEYQGVAPGARLVGIGVGEGLSVLFALEGLDFALGVREAYGLRVVSNSWGAPARPFEPYDPVNLATRRAYELGLSVVFAAGNAGPGPDGLNAYAASPCAIAVGAADDAGRLADLSSRGVPGDPLRHPDLLAPGVKVLSARAASAVLAAPYAADPLYGASYALMSGTSMSAPHVAGVAALLLEANPGWRMDDVLNVLARTARPVLGADGTKLGEWEAGAGFVDALAAVRLATRK